MRNSPSILNHILTKPLSLMQNCYKLTSGGVLIMAEITASVEDMAAAIKEIIDNIESGSYWENIYKYMRKDPALFFRALEIRYVGKKRLEKLKVAMTYEVKGKPDNSIEFFLHKQISQLLLNERSTLLTIGYESMELEKFIAKLIRNRVRVLIDVREKPISRKKGFAKSALCNALENSGIDYIHIRELGSPGEARKGLHNSNNWVEFSERYLEHLEGQKDILVELSKKIKKGSFCLMCFERDFNLCHRSLLAKELQKLCNIEVIHL